MNIRKGEGIKFLEVWFAMEQISHLAKRVTGTKLPEPEGEMERSWKPKRRTGQK